MLATVTVVEIDNRFIGRRFPLFIAKPRARLLADLREAVNQVDPETGDTIDACVLVDPWGAIRVVVYPGDTTGTVARIPGLDSVRDRELFIEEAHEERHLVDNLAENLLRFMDRGGLTIEALAELASMEPHRLAAIIAKRTPAAFLDEVCNLAECLGATVEALLQTPDDQEAEGWN